MFLTVSKRYTFESAHILHHHLGKCGRLHGHSYVLDVSVRGKVSPDDDKSDSGMVIDFADLSAIVKPHVVEVLDHQFINDVIGNPTAERMVEWIVGVLRDRIMDSGVDLTRVRLYETTTGWVEWTP